MVEYSQRSAWHFSHEEKEKEKIESGDLEISPSIGSLLDLDDDDDGIGGDVQSVLGTTLANNRILELTFLASHLRCPHAAREIRKRNIAKQEELRRMALEIKPDVILGTRKDDVEKWEKCLLKRILVDEQLVSSDQLVPTEQTVGTVYIPKQPNFGVGEAEKQLLFGTLPILTSTSGKDVTAQKKRTSGTEGVNPIPGHVSVEKLDERQEVWRVNIEKEHKKANLFAKVIDLRNANAAGIAYENRKRIIEAFSTPQNPFDPGRSEVQAALLTYKIRNLWNHLTTFTRDRGNVRGLRMLVPRRAKILKYLKNVDQTRYEILLQQLGLEPESVEGELVVA
ncbi:hypothetical protein C0995_006805 [Termitomyces sp. Mi166|nr:hypothetical protein C0995_006805 [Termitomyces sp. Mi166\